MITHDSLAAAEGAAIAEELASTVRDDLRNRFAILRAAASHLRRKIDGTEPWLRDPRVKQFFATIEQEVDASATLVNDRLAFDRMFARQVRSTDVAECVLVAVRNVRFAGSTPVRVKIDVQAATALVDPTELALAVRYLIENAAEALAGEGVVEVLGGPHGSDVSIEVAGAGRASRPPEPSRGAVPGGAKEGDKGLGLSIAQRICKRYGGHLALRATAQGTAVAIVLPLSGGADDDSLAGG